jgi:carbon monoxide dehydrogenase subunit G
MNFEGRYALPVSQQEAWEALNSPAVLKAAIAGCERFETIGPDTWLAVVRASVGPIGVTFRARLTVSDAQPPHRYTLTGEGQAGAAGHARLHAQIELEPGADPGSTLLSYSAQAEVGGKIASLGSRLMQSVVRRHTDAFFDALTAQLRPGKTAYPQEQTPGPSPIQATAVALEGARTASPGTAAPSSAAPAAPAAHPLSAPAPAWLVVFGTAVGIALGYCLGLLSR